MGWSCHVRKKRRRGKQLSLFPLPLPKNIVVVRAEDLDLSTEEGIDACVRRMFDVPMDKSILLDFLVGYKRGDPNHILKSEEHIELYRLQKLLNSRYCGKRFDFLGQGLVAHMFRESIRTESWNPFKEKPCTR
jgi:hypothetical protein